MFDIGFLEILIVAVLTLVVVGPERLPRTIHFIGRWIGRIRESFNAVRIEIEREVQAEEFRKRFTESASQANRSMNDIEHSIADSLGHGSVRDEDFPVATKPEDSGSEDSPDQPGHR